MTHSSQGCIHYLCHEVGLGLGGDAGLLHYVLYYTDLTRPFPQGSPTGTGSVVAAASGQHRTELDRRVTRPGPSQSTWYGAATRVGASSIALHGERQHLLTLTLADRPRGRKGRKGYPWHLPTKDCNQVLRTLKSLVGSSHQGLTRALLCLPER